MSSLAHSGTQFSTKDRDNDRCTCRCAQLASGGTLTLTLTVTLNPLNPNTIWPLDPNLAKHPCPPLGDQFIFPLRQYNVTADRQPLAWMLSFASLNQSGFFFQLSDSFVLQAGGLKRAVRPTSMAFTTPARPARCATTALSGTTGRAPIWWRQWRLWWCAQPVSGSVVSDEASLPQIKYDRQKKKYIFRE